MSEYIRREDAVSAVEFGITLASAINIETGEWTELFQRENDELRKAVERIKGIEPADVAPVRHARWERYSGITIRCSWCEHVIHDWRLSECKYCPNCGAKMDEEE